jgi:hypothetical protein
MDQEKEADLARIELLKDLLDCDEIFKRFAHLFALNVKVASVPEVVDPVVALIIGLALGDLVVVVGKHQIGAAQVNVDRVAQLLAHHR